MSTLSIYSLCSLTENSLWPAWQLMGTNKQV